MTALLISCEHATCAVPEAYREIFRGSEDAVASAAGWEPGSLNLAQAFSMKFRTPLVHGDVTRLLIDLGQDGDARWSGFSLKLPEATRQKVADRHERPFRTTLRQRIAEDLRRHARVLHLMVHTEAQSDGRVLLATPPQALLAESLASAWCSRLRAAELDVRHLRDEPRNAPAAAMALEFAADSYAQVRVSVSQSFFLEGRPWRWETLKLMLLDTLAQSMATAMPASHSDHPAASAR